MAYCVGFLEFATWGLKTNQIVLETTSIYILRRCCLGINNRSDNFENQICLHSWVMLLGIKNK